MLFKLLFNVVRARSIDGQHETVIILSKPNRRVKKEHHENRIGTTTARCVQSPPRICSNSQLQPAGQSNLPNDMPARRAIIMSWRFYKRIIGIVFYNNNNNNYIRVINAYAKEIQ